MKKDLSYLRFSYKLNLLMVSHCYQFSKNTIRIISARKATKSESKRYEAFL
ncbi:putative toxin-antitoxin system, toxin component [Leptospira interrogans str. FPW1039]|uniref:Putative toxin-antitoxin system, toxin component n=1 Tax=Leptospira interrogans str. FPW1039 TaxID=1193040 RepID=A0A0F6I7B2_LEPIR|nr:putative toxin-antitoxin system, toxin component [Leptospira interrogans serovar Hebdomadis str. R499]EMJ33937.1 putative toxin-antitoxin system, toxin component [Leptospira interrogans str. FPW1039]EMN93434.1 putative toxin-antitoxin system, toxin component [Leptospira interrogans serovar Medanensis str. UT053]KGE27542.1 toxin-antitoxin system, toxin component [Leptospira interrogans serovar Lai]